MIISLIVAMDEKRGIGFKGHIPWHLSADLKRFKAITMGRHLIMGRKTYESIGKPLLGRAIIVVTRNRNYDLRSQTSGDEVGDARSILMAHSLDEAFAISREHNEGEVFVCGGGGIYVQALPIADRIYLTLVHAVAEADTFFPAHNDADWIESWSVFHPADEKNQFSFTWKILARGDAGITRRIG